MKRTVDNCVRSIRTQKGWTQERLAQAAAVTRQTIIAIEQHRYEPTIGVALRIARALGVSVDRLFCLSFSEKESNNDAPHTHISTKNMAE